MIQATRTFCVSHLRSSRSHFCAGLFAALFAFLACLAPVAGAAETPLIVPTPQQAEWGAVEKLAGDSFTLKPGDGVAWSVQWEYSSFLREWGYGVGDSGVEISLVQMPMSECESFVTKPPRQRIFMDNPALQAYKLEAGAGGVKISACSSDGFFYGLMTLKKLLVKTDGGLQIQAAKITDFPSFPVRGIFEGAYGVWEIEGRLEVIDWMGEQKFNSFLYSPKGDPKMRRRWREKYDDIELFEFKRMVERAKKNHIQFSYTIAPTLGFEYGSEKDFEILLGRLRQLQGLGVRSFIIGFDDSMGMIYNERDREKFANLGEAEVFVTNKLFAALKEYDPETVLVLVPEIYAGVYEMDYTRAIAEKLDKDIYIGWTGSEIGAPKIDAESMQKFIDFYGRIPSLGDNWGSLYPLVARNTDIHEYTTQFAVNPYNLFGELPIPGLGGASEPPLAQIECAPVAQFAWNPADYDTDKMLDTVTKLNFDESARDVFRWLIFKEFYDYTKYYVLDTDYTTPVHKAILSLSDSSIDKDQRLATAQALLDGVNEVLENPDVIISGAVDEEVGKALHNRAIAWAGYFEEIQSGLKTVIGALVNGDEDGVAKVVDELVRTLKKEDS